MSILSDRLRELRGDTSQAEMARELGIQRTQWIKYENGESAPGSEILAKICRVHACSSDWLLGLSNNCSVRQNNYVRATSGGIAIGGNVSGTVVGGGRDKRVPPACSKCPFKKKLQALEKVMGKKV